MRAVWKREKCDSIRYAWQKCLDLGKKVQSDLEVIAPQFQAELISSVEQFRQDNIDFEEAYAYEGPMVDGIKPAQASERLAVFQSRFDGLFRIVFRSRCCNFLLVDQWDSRILKND